MHGKHGVGVTDDGHHDLKRTFNSGIGLIDNERDEHLNEYPKAIFMSAVVSPVGLILYYNPLANHSQQSPYCHSNFISIMFLINGM